MKEIWMIQTYDGELHKTQKDAERYLDRIYGDVLLPLSHRLVRETDGKYKGVPDFVDNNLDSFLLLAKIKADFILLKEEDIATWNEK